MNQLIVILFCAVTFGFSAQNIITYQHALWGGTAHNSLRSIHTSDGGMLLISTVGFDSNMGMIDPPYYGGSFIWVVKLNANYELVWQKSFGGSGFDSAHSVIELNNSIYIGATSDSPVSGNKTVGNQGEQDVWLIRIDYEGDILEQYAYGGSGSDKLVDLKSLSDGNLFILCSSNSPQSGSKSEPNYGPSDFWALKIAPDGTLLWEKTYGSEGWDLPCSAIELSNGSLFLTGSSLGGASGIKTATPIGEDDYWVLKINPSNGAPIWDRVYGGVLPDDLITAVSDGHNLFLYGMSYSDVSGTRTVPLLGFIDTWFLKLNEDGEPLIDLAYGGDAGDFIYSVVLDNQHLFLSISSSSGISGNKTEESRGSTDYWLVKTDLNGQIMGQKTIGGDALDQIRGVSFPNNQSILVHGRTLSGVSGDKTIPKLNPDGPDTWLVELDAITLNVVSQLPSDFLVFPNPIREKLTVHLSEHNVPLSIDIMDASGKRITTESNIHELHGQMHLDFSGWSSGIYFLQIHTNSGNQTVRVVKE